MSSIIAWVNSSGLFFQALRAVLFERPRIDDVESQPFRATQNGNAQLRSGPRILQSWLISMMLLFLPVPKQTKTLQFWNILLKWPNCLIGITTTSQTTVLTSTIIAPACSACETCITILVSASSWSDFSSISYPGRGLHETYWNGIEKIILFRHHLKFSLGFVN